MQIISSSYEREGKLITCPPYPEDFDGHEYYNFLRNKGVVKTSLIPAAQMEDAFRPVLAAGEDVLYITLSSGISGTVASGLQAAQALMEEFPSGKCGCWIPWALGLVLVFSWAGPPTIGRPD